jgi:hypothetical protein
MLYRCSLEAAQRRVSDRMEFAMRRNALLAGLWAALLTALVLAVGATAASATTQNVTYYGGPVMNSENWVEVVWGSGLEAENPKLPGEVASYLSDDAADSGKTTNVFAVLAQYSTIGLGGSEEVAAYNQSFVGSTQIAPSACAGASACALNEHEIESELRAQIAAEHLPAPSGEGLTTAYLVLFPSSVTITDNYSDVSDQQWCSEYGGTRVSGASSAHLLFAMVPDLGAEPGCGNLVHPNENVIVNVSHQQHELITNPLAAESADNPEPPTGWVNTTYGTVADICNQQTTTNVIDGHSWPVEKVWSNVDEACVGSTGMFHEPHTDFGATTRANTVQLIALGESTNHLTNIPAGIAHYSWNFGDGESGEGASFEHAYATAGEYTVTLTATDSLGFTAHASHQVTVSAPPANTGGNTGSSGNTGSTGNNASTGNGSIGTQGTAPTAKASISPAGGASTTTTGSSVVVSSGETATCPPQGGACVVTVQAEVESAHTAAVSAKKHKPKSHKVVVGSANTTVAAGATAKLTFKLNAAGKALLQAHHSLLVRLVVTIRHGNEAAVVSTHTITISAPKKHGHK